MRIAGVIRGFSAVALAVAAMVCAAPAEAQFRRAPESRAEILTSFAPVVKSAAPAVVNVYVRRRVQERAVSPFMDDPFFRRFLGPGFGMPRERVQNALGSGVIVDGSGLVVTNYHVIQGRGEADIKVAMSDGREFEAAIALTDEKTDLAVLRIQGNGETFAALDFADSDALEVGDLVLAIGNPFGVGQTVTSGIISATARTRVGISDYQFFIQTDAAINPGNSGGALVDMAGRLVGVNTAIYSRSGGSNGIGFAIPSNMVRLVLQSALTGGVVQRPWLGASLQAIDANLAATLGLDRPQGALVTDVAARGPADKAGLRVGDVILSVDGRKVEDPQAFTYRFTTKGIGAEAELGILRSGRERTITIETIAAPEVPPRDVRVLAGRHPFAGAQVANLSPALAEELGVTDTRGVVVVGIDEQSTARSIGLQRGDIIVSINGEEVGTSADLEALLSQRVRGWQLAIRRDGRTLSMVLRG